MKLLFPRRLPLRELFPPQKLLGRFFSSSSNAGPKLYSRISPLGDPNISVVPELDRWVHEGRPVDKEELRQIIKELRVYKRFKHALEISQWMSDKRYIPLSTADFISRLNLIFQVHGLEQVEAYFNNIPEKVKNSGIYVALLNCYANGKSVEKAELLMQKMRDMGFATTSLSYNLMMNLYYKIGDYGKVDAITLEMEEKGIDFDQYTFSIRLSAYAAVSNIEGMDNIIEKMESRRPKILDWNSYAIAADAYLRVGLPDKAMVMVKKLEKLIVNTKGNKIAFDLLLKLYAKIGKKDELHRIWKLYKAKEKIFNKGYISMISSLLAFDDIEAAEKIFGEWESRKLSYDFRVPNLLVNAYCRKGIVGKAEALVEKGISKGGKPLVDSWYNLGNAFLEDNQIPKAVEALKEAIAVCPPGWKPSKETLATCLEYLEGKGDPEGAEKFINLLRVEGLFSELVHGRLLNYIKGGKSKSSELFLVEGNVDEKTDGFSERRELGSN